MGQAQATGKSDVAAPSAPIVPTAPPAAEPTPIEAPPGQVRKAAREEEPAG
jgi:hypothetical protein